MACWQHSSALFTMSQLWVKEAPWLPPLWHLRSISLVLVAHSRKWRVPHTDHHLNRFTQARNSRMWSLRQSISLRAALTTLDTTQQMTCKSRSWNKYGSTTRTNNWWIRGATRRQLHTCVSGVRRVDVWRPRSSAVKSILMKQLISSRREALFVPTGRLKIGTPTMTRLKLNRVLRAMAMRLTFEMNSGTE